MALRMEPDGHPQPRKGHRLGSEHRRPRRGPPLPSQGPLSSVSPHQVRELCLRRRSECEPGPRAAERSCASRGASGSTSQGQGQPHLGAPHAPDAHQGHMSLTSNPPRPRDLALFSPPRLPPPGAPCSNSLPCLPSIFKSFLREPRCKNCHKTLHGRNKNPHPQAVICHPPFTDGTTEVREGEGLPWVRS